MTIEITIKGRALSVERIDLALAGRDILEGRPEAISRHINQQIARVAKAEYGDFRPIQIVSGGMIAAEDYRVFIDLKSYSPVSRLSGLLKNHDYSQLGIIFFIPSADFMIATILDRLGNCLDWDGHAGNQSWDDL